MRMELPASARLGRDSVLPLRRLGCSSYAALPSTNIRRAVGAGQSNRAADRVIRRGAVPKVSQIAEAMVSHLKRGVAPAGPGWWLWVLARAQRARVAVCGLTTACRRRRVHSS